MAGYACAFAFIAGLLHSNAQTPALPDKLLQPADLTYDGACAPPSVDGPPWFSPAAYGLAWNPTNSSFIVSGAINDDGVTKFATFAELKCPTRSKDYSAMPRATVLQALRHNPGLDANWQNVGVNGTAIDGTMHVGGLLVYNGKLIGTTYAYYDAGWGADRSHWTIALDNLAGPFGGLFKVGDGLKTVHADGTFDYTGINPGFTAGYMATLPADWQAVFNAKAITGACCYAIIGRSSLGPAAFLFDPDGLGATAAKITPLVYYPHDHPTLGTWEGNGQPNLLYNMATAVTGVIPVGGTSTLLFVGVLGTGAPCYGIGYPTQPIPANTATESYCYDPDNSNKATHAFPYKNWAWFYDARELLKVSQGTLQPWDVKPYATADLTALGLDYGGHIGDTNGVGVGIQGASYDEATHTIVLSQNGGAKLIPGANYYSFDPLFRFITVNAGQSPSPTPVPAPAPAPAPSPAPVPAPPPPPADTTPPTLALTVVRNGSSANYATSALATDAGPGGVVKITIALDGVVRLTCLNVGQCAMTLPIRPAGVKHTVVATAQDAAGNTSIDTKDVTR